MGENKTETERDDGEKRECMSCGNENRTVRFKTQTLQYKEH